MKRFAAGTALLAATAWVSMSGQQIRDPHLIDADVAWDRGDYPTALKAYLSLLDTGDERTLESIALQTGELYQTIELTNDGGAPRFSPDGRYFVYEAGRGIGRTTRLAAVDEPAKALAELRGHGAAFSPDGSELVYLKLTPTPEMLELERGAEDDESPNRAVQLAQLTESAQTAARITIRDVVSGAEREIDVGPRRKSAAFLGANGVVLFTSSEAGGAAQVYSVSEGRAPVALTSGAPDKTLQEINGTGTAAIFTLRIPAGRGRGGGAPQRFGVISLPDGAVTMVTGSVPAFSADGRSFAFINRTASESQLLVGSPGSAAQATPIRAGVERLDEPALSRDGSRIAFQRMSAYDWELFVINRDGTGERRISRDIQHDVMPQFLTGDRLLGLMGEQRHRRSFLYDVTTGARTRLFHNNTVRTVAPEYAWAVSADGTKILIVSERDGDTVSPERGVYLVDLNRKVTRDQLRARLHANLSAEEALRAKARRMYAPIADAVKRVVADAAVSRVYAYEKALFDFDSKDITQPGNRLASSYLFDTYKSFGYEPEYQWFAGRGALGGQTANVVAMLKGTTNPELVYVVSSHYDSDEDGPGADDNSSGTAALLEAARILAGHPQPATIVFASFTGEEAGLLGSREFVRRAVAENVQIVGALNNDMIGWANDNRLDDTIRYSNPGIRDVQHGAALQFTNLITYDAVYYKNTDAHAYYEAYGDIVGGIGSYPILSSPHYHQPHDVLETVNHQLVTEVAKTTAATLMLLASSPSRVSRLKVTGYQNGAATLTWTPSREKGVTGYIVSWGPADKPDTQQLRVTKSAATIKAAAGSVVSVRAVNDKGLEGWDAGKVEIK